MSSIRPHITTPQCEHMVELTQAHDLRGTLNARLASGEVAEAKDALTVHLLHGLAYTVGSALGSKPPTRDQCLAAFQIPNKVGLTAGARAWSKHAHRSAGSTDEVLDAGTKGKKAAASSGWWGTPSGPVTAINERALALFWRVVDSASWRNLHWLPHGVLVYEARAPEGYGMRWAQDLSGLLDEDDRTRVRHDCADEVKKRPWQFRGFVEPMMENGHEVGWRH
ncbi:hypothetical protein PsYK624_134930 [Phanerochaete sordida]|uniref:Uncharacterized protein n=1 Tax=Phanerochaete sordida TaxID=48140 RepID=A0A9P3GL28_9APHY|nr:hypothetical protein PsYK624_134930 [Phanerochaete sordida]